MLYTKNRLELPLKRTGNDLNEDQETTLDTLKPGEKASITKVRVKGTARRKLMDMGMVAGTEIELVRNAPLGDPMDYNIKGYHLSIRKEEAKQIFITKL
ncbi:MAG: ferrous iron transport protein [Methanolobus sp.]|uniref:Fe2+ transport system protein A n=1 Tax=Methanolobus tindarius DSM 2278 TaxID=1090322 RepID=W9DQQ3_METTI|nr:Fe2+ transport system protein A [Methanolobus tindarius DSM 2278]MDI3486605.1 ferrous iron transport protein [Methanolobus sp.]MDK2831974.1 ferrous iron transport protein [Methanolobus sp.]MDK2939780.1 ferrous iron transport protein [Methanolobus sp.]